MIKFAMNYGDDYRSMALGVRRSGSDEQNPEQVRQGSSTAKSWSPTTAVDWNNGWDDQLICSQVEMVPEAEAVWTANQMNISAGTDVDGDELAITLEYDCIGDDFGGARMDQPNTEPSWDMSRVKEADATLRLDRRDGESLRPQAAIHDHVEYSAGCVSGFEPAEPTISVTVHR